VNKFSVLLVFIIGMSQSLNSQSLIALNAPFEQGKSMQFSYSGGTGAATDWIGIYKKNQIPGNVSSTVWQYISVSSGTVTFDGSLDTGFYDIHLFCCDGYTKLASILNFHVNATLFNSKLTYYKTTDSLTFYANNVLIGDKISVYKTSDFSNGILINGAVPLLEKAFSNSIISSKTTFSPTLISGQYVGVFQSNIGEIRSFEAFEVKNNPVLPSTITRLGLGSCGNQNSFQPGLQHILTKDIDAFVFGGDNLYIDTYNATTIKTEYEKMLTKRTEFQKLRATVPLFATWDDHDYGCCDEDKDYPLKAQSQQLFLDFFEEPVNSIRRTQNGIYTKTTVGADGQKLQIILLDSRYFLDNKRSNNGCGINDYCAWAGPNDGNKTILGDAQWLWLKNALLEPADLRMIVSSVQFSSSYHGFESWTLFPYQRKKMQELIKETQAEHVFFVSGDMHYSEVSKLDNDPTLYPIYDFTASGLNTSWPPETNQNRVENKAYGQPNVGFLDIDWQNKTVTYAVLDAQNIEQFNHTIGFNEMEFGTIATQNLATKFELKMQQIPNPSHEDTRLVFSEKTTGTLQIYHNTGQLVQEINLIDTENIEINGLNAGIYFAKVISLHKQIILGKILIN
jgi:alkaline phosphatase D